MLTNGGRVPSHLLTKGKWNAKTPLNLDNCFKADDIRNQVQVTFKIDDTSTLVAQCSHLISKYSSYHDTKCFMFLYEYGYKFQILLNAKINSSELHCNALHYKIHSHQLDDILKVNRKQKTENINHLTTYSQH